MNNGQLNELKRKFVKIYGEDVGVMRQSEFRLFCNTHGVCNYGAEILSAQLYHDCIADIQFDAHVDALESQPVYLGICEVIDMVDPTYYDREGYKEEGYDVYAEVEAFQLSNNLSWYAFPSEERFGRRIEADRLIEKESTNGCIYENLS